MRFLEKLALIERIDALIRRKGTGSARELALRVNVSKSTIYEILEVMKCMGAEVDYCNDRRSYFYTADKTLSIGFVDSQKVRGGQSNINVLNNCFSKYFI